MEMWAKAKYVRVSPPKARRVIDEIKSFDYNEAIDILRFLPQASARLVLKLLRSALANARIVNPDLKEDDVYIKEIWIDEGPTLKRFIPRARGRATRIRKRTSHINVVISDE